jgi:predicted ATP-dependent serine protease
MNTITITAPKGTDVYVCAFCATVQTVGICDDCQDYNLTLTEAIVNGLFGDFSESA